MAAVEWAAEEFQSRTGTNCRLDLPEDDIVIDRERATALFRILQETLTNIARHANATEVNVRLTKEEGSLILEVHDNGKGISKRGAFGQQVARNLRNAGAGCPAGRRACHQGRSWPRYDYRSPDSRNLSQKGGVIEQIALSASSLGI
jgi:two-component sensor histidine kinase